MNEEYNNSKSIAYIRMTDYSFAFFKRGLKPEGGVQESKILRGCTGKRFGTRTVNSRDRDYS